MGQGWRKPKRRHVLGLSIIFNLCEIYFAYNRRMLIEKQYPFQPMTSAVGKHSVLQRKFTYVVTLLQIPPPGKKAKTKHRFDTETPNACRSTTSQLKILLRYLAQSSKPSCIEKQSRAIQEGITQIYEL